MLAIADTGSGPTILRIMDLASAEEVHKGWHEELDPADVRLLTADGTLLQTLAGATDVKLRIPGSVHDFDLRVQVVGGTSV